MQKIIDSMIAERVRTVIYKLNNNEEYKVCSNKRRELLIALKKSLPTDEGNTLMELNELSGFKEAVGEEIMYVEGFVDGLKAYNEITKWLVNDMDKNNN